jgi:TetR/AcrR family transcriptional repressor of nem operon
MKGRPTVHIDQDIIQKAQDIFWKKGYGATSLTDLSKTTGAGAGSLYNTFKGGKKELFKKSLIQRNEAFNVFKTRIESSDKPIELIKDFFLNISNADRESHLKGCIVANTLVEMTFVDEELKNESIEILMKTEALYKDVILSEQKQGNVKSKVPADVLAKFLITLWCGINSLRRIYPDKKILKKQLELQLQIIN